MRSAVDTRLVQQLLAMVRDALLQGHIPLQPATSPVQLHASSLIECLLEGDAARQGSPRPRPDYASELQPALASDCPLAGVLAEPSLLFARRNQTHVLRQQLLSEQRVLAVVNLPHGLLRHSGIGLCLILLVPPGTADTVTLLDASITDAGFAESGPTKRQRVLIDVDRLATTFWECITAPMLEEVRRKLRGLVQFIERKGISPVYSALTDEIGTSTEVALSSFSTGINLAQYKRKVEAFIRASESHIAIAKLRLNKPLTPTDLSELERFVFESDAVENRERFEQTFGTETPLTLFIRSLVGLDRNAAKEAFGHFLDDTRYGSQQIRFIDMIIDRLTRQGVMDPGLLYEAPFTGLHYEGVDGLFDDRDARQIITTVSEINQRAAA